MNMFSIARRYLHVQKKRTILTAVGVALAVALVSGSGILLASFIQARQTQASMEEGTWHYMVSGVKNRPQADQFKSNVLFQNAGIAARDTSLAVNKKDGKTETIQLLECDAAALPMMPDTITQGRAPKSNGEIMISTSAEALFPGGVKLGDSVTLPWGILTSDVASGSSDDSGNDTVFTMPNEGSFTPKGSRTFIVVGFFKSGIYYYENIESAVTLDPTGDHAYSVYAQIKPGLNFPDSIRRAAADCGIEAENIHENGIVEWMGKSASTKVKTAVVTTFLILAAIILAVTMLVIRNSFAMSAAEEISEIGTLRCLGASPGHIRSLVLSEALCVWAAGASVGLLASFGAMSGVIAAVRNIAPDEFRFFSIAPAAWPYLLAAALSLATVLLSAFGPVRTTMRVPMVEAVRGNAVYRESGIRKNKKGRLLGRMFGFSGLLAAKNIRRSPHQFHTTMLSVVASVILFIAVGGFSLSVGTSLQVAARMTSGGDYEFTASGGIPESVKGLDDIAQSVKQMNNIASAQRTPIHTADLNVPIGRVPADYLKTYKDFRDFSPDTSSGAIDQGLLILEVSRENYSSLRFEGKTPSYDELVKSGGALFCETRFLTSQNGRFASAVFADYRPGETLAVTQTVRPAADKKDAVKRTLNVKIAGLLSELPWFAPQYNGVLVFPEGGAARFGGVTVVDQNGENSDVDDEIHLKIRYAKGAEAQADARMKEFSAAAMKSGVGFHDNYQAAVNSRNSFLVMAIFVWGFSAVIILICCINLFNTIHANLQARKREIAMTRAVGMDHAHLRRMLLLECSLYGILGTLWGIVIGLPLQFLLINAFHAVIASSPQTPFLMALIALAATVGIGILAGLSSIRRILKTPIVEGIRAQE